MLETGRFDVDSTNRDLGVFPGLFGLKTGDTASAGQILLAYDVGQHGSLLAVVLGSSNRRTATEELLAWARTALGPRDYFLAPTVGTDLELLFPDWYVTWLKAAGPLPTGNPTVPASTPLVDAVNTGLSTLLPSLLGGGRHDAVHRGRRRPDPRGAGRRPGCRDRRRLRGRDPVLLGVLKGAVPFLADLSPAPAAGRRDRLPQPDPLRGRGQGGHLGGHRHRRSPAAT